MNHWDFWHVWWLFCGIGALAKSHVMANSKPIAWSDLIGVLIVSTIGTLELLYFVRAPGWGHYL